MDIIERPFIFVHSWYGYIPALDTGIIFVALFAASTVIHVGQTIYFKTWWIIPTICMCGLLETVGWACRLYAHQDPEDMGAFEVQTVTTIVGPTPLLSACVIVFGKIIENLGTSYSRLTPLQYSIIFTTCEVVALIAQGVGGALSAAAGEAQRDTNPGARLALAAICFQLVVMILFMTCTTEYIIRYSRNAPVKDSYKNWYKPLLTPRVRTISIALGFVVICLLVRAIYRVAELSGGWESPFLRNPVYFNFMEAMMIAVACWTFNFIHPGYFLAVRRPKHRSLDLNA